MPSEAHIYKYATAPQMNATPVILWCNEMRSNRYEERPGPLSSPYTRETKR